MLDDISAHADALPDVPDFNKLKTTAREFAEEVRDSQAAPSMSAAQQNLLSSNFPGAADQAKSAADILESFLSKCEGMGARRLQSVRDGVQSLRRRRSLGNSIQQMLAMMGMKPGMSQGNGQGMGFGFGAGGGYAVRSPGPQNVGMYGSMPIPQQCNSRGRGDRKTQGFATNSSASPQQAGSAAADQCAEGQAAGQAASSVPPQYRSQVAEYFRQLAEQLGEETMNASLSRNGRLRDQILDRLPPACEEGRGGGFPLRMPHFVSGLKAAKAILVIGVFATLMAGASQPIGGG